MLSGSKLKDICERQGISTATLAEQIARRGENVRRLSSAVKNWQKNLYKPVPKRDDVERLAGALGVEAGELSVWKASYRYAPISPRKARLVTELIAGRAAQESLDVLKFTHNRAASMIRKTLEAAIANADEAEADVESLYVSEARVDSAGLRINTKRWIPKDRGRAHPIRKMASHIHITVAERE